ncbi:MAG: glycosyltransferase family 9 protein [Planctomycetota bacterium]|nr:glycosyltransferase family 9 protein [Planctomycetota bacterium]
MSSRDSIRPLRLLIVMPSWLGDCVMATPALARLRRGLPGCFIGGLVRPGMDELLAGSALFDELHVHLPQGVMSPKHAAAKVRPRRYDAALLLTNSFSTALITRLADIPRRVGYDRDLRGILLTEKLIAPKTASGAWAMIPACEYYHRLADQLLGEHADAADNAARPTAIGRDACLSLGVTPEQEAKAAEIKQRAGLTPGEAYAVLNPGGNNPAKRWPPERFAALADHLFHAYGCTILLNGSPGERAIIESIAELSHARCVSLAALGNSIGSLKAIVRDARLMVTNDTGPRHIAAAFGVPLVSLFGPTDHRWTTIPTRASGPERIIVADPTLAEDQSANDHPERCAIEHISVERVIEGADAVLGAASREPTPS